MDALYRSSAYQIAVPLILRASGPVHVWLYRACRGRVVDRLSQGAMPVLLLTTVGRRTGRERTQPVGYVRDGATWLVIGSNGALSRDPGWVFNIRGQPRVTIQVGAVRMTARADILRGAKRETAWGAMVSRYRFFETYQSAAMRRLPVIRLTPDAP